MLAELLEVVDAAIMELDAGETEAAKARLLALAAAVRPSARLDAEPCER